MSIDSIVLRLQKATNQLKTITSLRTIQDMSRKREKPCACAHHRSTSASRCPGKCNSNNREKKKSHCSCPQRPKLCSCTPRSDVTSDYEPKKFDIEHVSKWRSEKSPRREKSKEIIDKAYAKSPIDENSQWRSEKSSGHKKLKDIMDKSFDGISTIGDTKHKYEESSHREKPKEIMEKAFAKKSVIADEATRPLEQFSHREEPNEIVKKPSKMTGIDDESRSHAGKSGLREQVREITNKAIGKKTGMGEDSKLESEKSSNDEKPKEIGEKAFEKKSGNGDDSGWRSEKFPHQEKSKEIMNDAVERISRIGDDSQRQSEKSQYNETPKEVMGKAVEKILGMGNNLKWQSEKSANHEKSKGVMDRAIETMTLDDRYISNDRKRRDDKPERIHNLEATTIASQTPNIVERNETLEFEMLSEDKKNIEQMYKDLKKQNVELEEKLARMDCSISCLREEGDKQAACLKYALEKAMNEAKLASRSRNLAMDLAKQSRDQTDLVKTSRDEIINQINLVKCENTKLTCECDELKCKLKEITNNEDKRCAEVADKVNKMKCASEQKEIELTNEKSGLKKSVDGLTNHVQIQKKRICDLTTICTKQRDLLRENEICIATKIAQLTKAEDKIETASCKGRQMQEQIDELQCRLNDETMARENLQKVLAERQDNCNCELQIKNKIIGDQIETIKKLKKLLQDSEKMAHQAACEFESLRDELHSVKQSNKSLRNVLEEIEGQTVDDCVNSYCDRCNVLEARINSLEEQKDKAVMAAKFAAAKLCKTTTDYERQHDCEKQQTDYLNNLIQRQETEIQLLKKEILCVKEFRSRRSNDYINRQ